MQCRTLFPTADETGVRCDDGLDNDCDGLVDEELMKECGYDDYRDYDEFKEQLKKCRARYKFNYIAKGKNVPAVGDLFPVIGNARDLVLKGGAGHPATTRGRFATAPG